MEWQERGPDKLGFSEKDFKVCDFCSALNPVANTECFVCGWRGKFLTDKDTIRDAMKSLESHYGGLSESLFVEEVVPSIPPKTNLWSEFIGSLKRFFSRK